MRCGFLRSAIILKTDRDSENNLAESSPRGYPHKQFLARKRRRADLKNKISMAFIKLMSLFSLKTARKIGKFVGYCAYLANTRLYRTSLTNLRLCFPELSENESRRLALLSLKNTGMTLAESGPVW